MRSGGAGFPALEARGYASTPEAAPDGDGVHRRVTRRELLGVAAGDGDLSFEIRYFEIQPGGFSACEWHEHPHAVVVLAGAGEVELDDRVEPLGPFDCVFVAPRSVHQFRATGSLPLGFLCVVDRDRDRPRRLALGEPGPPG